MVKNDRDPFAPVECPAAEYDYKPEFLKRGPKPTGKAMTGAQRSKKWRESLHSEQLELIRKNDRLRKRAKKKGNRT